MGRVLCPKCGNPVYIDPSQGPIPNRIWCPTCGSFVATGVATTSSRSKGIPSLGKLFGGGSGGGGGSEPPKEESAPRGEGIKEKSKVVVRKISSHGISERSFSAIIVAAIFGLSLIVPYFNIMTRPLRQTLLDLLVIPFPNIPNSWPAIWTFSSILITAFATLWAWSKGSIWIGILWLLFLVLVVYPLYYFVPPILDRLGASEFLPSLMCTLQNLGDPEGMGACQMEQFEEEEVEKIGEYEVLEVRFDTETTENLVYKEPGGQLLIENYFVNLEITNPSNTETIKGFKIIECPDYNCISGSYLRRGGSVTTRQRIKFGALQTTDGTYMEENCPTPEDCVIEPGQTLMLTLQGVPFDLCSGRDESDCKNVDVCKWDDPTGSCIDAEDRLSQYVEARVMFSYDYAVEGKYDFIVTTSDEVLRPLLRNRLAATSSAGPLDVKIGFGPTAYVFRDPTLDTAEVAVMITLKKEDDGNTAYIKDPIKINKLDDGSVLTALGTCSAPWGESVNLVNGEIGIGGERPLKKSHTYVCKYEISRGGVGPDGEVIPFIVVAQYRFEKILINRFVEVVEEI